MHVFKIRSFHSSHISLPFSYFFWKVGKLDVSQGRHLLEVRTGNVMPYFVFVLAGQEKQYIFWYIQYTFEIIIFFGWGMDITGNFLKDTAIFVKQLLLKVWHNGKVYHSLKCCFSSVFKLLFKGVAIS